MKEKRLNSLSVKLSQEEENNLYEVTQHLHDTKNIPNNKTAAIRYMIEEAYTQAVISRLPDTEDLISEQ